MKLNKTQSALIEAANRRGGVSSFETHSGRGPFGGRISAGLRDRAALHSLVALGLVEIVKTDTNCPQYQNGYAMHYTVFTYRILKVE
jgi:hypothetical protein